MKCPHGLEVGDPPELTRCPLGFPGCHCGDDAMEYLDIGVKPSSLVWWEEQGQL